MALVLDAGALIALERRDRGVGSLLSLARDEQLPARTSSAVVAQVWRGGPRQHGLARLLAGVEVAALGPSDGRRVGELLARSGTSDVTDAHLVLLADEWDVVVTSDPDDISGLLQAGEIRATLYVV